MRTNQLFINGKWSAPAGRQYQVVFNPYTQKPLARVASGDGRDVHKAVLAARRSFDSGVWSQLPPSERQKVLLKLVSLLEKNLLHMAKLESANQGKTIRYARESDFPFLIDTFRFFAGACRMLEGPASGEYSGLGTDIIRREPIGVVGCIIPWNYPLYIAAWQIAPALAAGNSVVAKPASLTPLTLLKFGTLAQAAGVPDGVLNIITGKGEVVGKAMAQHHGIDMLSFTGDTTTGKRIIAASAARIKRLHLELGGKAPAVILPDADLEAAARGCAIGAFWNSGQDCTAVTRVLVHKKQEKQLTQKLVSVAKTFRLGNQLKETTDMGPLVSRHQQERVAGYVQAAVNEGAKVVCGGKALPHNMFPPTILTNVRQHARVCQEEIFGPVLIVQSYGSLEEAIKKANDVQYGLAASVWGKDITACMKVSAALNFGTVWINDHGILSNEMPHGGFKQSGFGKDMSRLSLEEYMRVKHIYVDQTGRARKPWHWVVLGKKTKG